MRPKLRLALRLNGRKTILIGTVPGIGVRCAEVIAAETGADMSIFPTAAHLASWAGTRPGSNESAGRVKSTVTRPGNPYLKAALGAGALSIANTHGTYLAAKYRRIAALPRPRTRSLTRHEPAPAAWLPRHTQPRRRISLKNRVTATHGIFASELTTTTHAHSVVTVC
jgi:transposase